MNTRELCDMANQAAHEMEQFLGITFTIQEYQAYTEMYTKIYFESI